MAIRTADPPAPATTRVAVPRKRRRDYWALVPFLGPALGFYIMFLIIPLLGTVFLSLTDWNGFDFGAIHFVGASNYTELAHDPVFVRALWHTLAFVAVAVVLKTAGSLAAALALNERLPLSTWFRAVYVMPTVISMVVIGVVFNLALSPTLGLINPFLEAIGLGGFAGDWLGDPNKALPIIILLDVWQNFGIYMLIYISRLVAIPDDLSEAARVDGASRWQEIRRVTIPLLRSTTGTVMLLAGIDSLKVFTTVYVMTRGGPDHATEVLSTWGYSQAFTQNDVGYGSAIMVVLLAIAFVFAFVWLRIFRNRGED
jgi:raffinose/stachyose/melibiose transport system permease protein